MYHMTYISGGFKVKGYLVLPHGFELPITELGNLVNSHYEAGELPITKLSSTLPASYAPVKQHIGMNKWPVFIYCRGGIGKVGRVKTDWLETFGKFGHIVFAPCYRGNEGGEGRDEFGGIDKEDVLSAYRFLTSLPFVDTARITLMGFSRGAINASQTAVEMPGVHKLALWGGVSDLSQTYEERVDLRRMLRRVVGGTPNKKPELYHSRSPIHLAEQINCPVLIMHGTADEQVDYSHGHNMWTRLRELGADVQLHRYDGYGHHLPRLQHEAAIENMFEWIGGAYSCM